MIDNQKNVTLELNTKMVEIYRTRDEGNKVVGIRVANDNGYKTIKAEKALFWQRAASRQTLKCVKLKFLI